MDELAIRDSGCAETIVVPSHHGSSHESKRETQDIIKKRRGSCTLLDKADRKENLGAEGTDGLYNHTTMEIPNAHSDMFY